MLLLTPEVAGFRPLGGKSDTIRRWRADGEVLLPRTRFSTMKGEAFVRKWLAGILLVLGLAGLGLGWAGETVWAPDSEHTASVKLTEPGAAVVINPGVLYVGGQEGSLSVKADAPVSLIAAPTGDAQAFLKDVPHTAITGVPAWGTLSTEKVNPEGKADTVGITESDMWDSVTPLEESKPVPIETFSKVELDPKKPIPYRTLIIAGDGKNTPVTNVTISWPSHASNAWAPFAVAIGAVFLIIGLVLLLLALTVKRSEDPDDAVSIIEEDDEETADPLAEFDAEHTESDVDILSSNAEEAE